MYLNLSYFTGSSSAIYERGTNASFLEMASLSSLPFGIDDPPKGLKGNGIGDLRIDLYQGGKTAKLCKGALSPRSLPLVATNFSIRTEARYIFMYTILLSTIMHAQVSIITKVSIYICVSHIQSDWYTLILHTQHILHCPLNVPLI